MKYAAGLDGGGTKTAVAIVDEEGRTIRRFDSGAINYNGQDDDSIRGTFSEIIAELAEACGGLNRCAHVCIGAAGVSNPSVPARMTAAIRDCGYMGDLTIAGDQETALHGALERNNGLIVIAGTGSICYGINESGISHRTGGFGHLIDDEGSGYSIGRDLLTAVVRAYDGRDSATVITRMVFDRLGFKSVGELVGFVYDRNRNKQEIAALAPILSEACEQGDPAALRIADRSAQSLVGLVVPVAERLSLQRGTLAMDGSVLLHNARLQGAFLYNLAQRYPEMACILPKRDAAAGAAMMALSKMNDVPPPSV
ncbi:N-acetylglucosamine kinase [Paenibacillus montanisoli]|uniref:ATPase n=1 Tax=Paenibacillus montanisoli TaxID=2081970 RepID=A0A328U0E5_9BACL|nr:BadF/BadG/BcrA/BcrD ATPase family protein [Paenibacillus montanisoli]RAP74921.1 ATPase [Paenibacillus montanisoli]